MPRTAIPFAPQFSKLLALFLTFWPFVGYCNSQPVAESPLSATHYLIPGFSNHLLIYGRLVYEDLLEARIAAHAHDTLQLRLDLAGANGHLLQLATPPSLATLRQQMVAVRQALSGRNHTPPDIAWATLIASIKKLPMHRADQPARARLQRTAEFGRRLTVQGNLAGARDALSQLIGEIEITSHVFPITAVRKSVGDAVDAASAFSPHWVQAGKAINIAIKQTHWIVSLEASRMIHAFDGMVAAYIELPESPSQSRKSLQHAAWWLSFDHSDGGGDHDAALLRDIYHVAQARHLTLHRIGALQTRLADIIRRERLIAAQKK